MKDSIFKELVHHFFQAVSDNLFLIPEMGNLCLLISKNYL